MAAKLESNLEPLWRDMYFDAQERINELLRDRALYASHIRCAAYTLKIADYPLTAQSLLNTVEHIEEREAKNIALLEDSNITKVSP